MNKTELMTKKMPAVRLATMMTLVMWKILVTLLILVMTGYLLSSITSIQGGGGGGGRFITGGGGKQSKQLKTSSDKNSWM